MIRSFMPLDVVDLLVAGKALSNKARTRESVGGKEARFGDLANMVFGWFNPRQRSSAWVYTEGLALKGLASVTNRCTPRSWDVNRLMVADQDPGACFKLLEHVSTAAGQQQIGRIFLCLPVQSPLLKPAQDTGFLAYASEHLYCRERADGAPAAGGAPTGLAPRRKKTDDEYRLFDLYLKFASPQIRRAEGTTYKEWQANRRRSPGQEWVFEKDGEIVGWAATSAGHHGGLLDIPAVTREDMEGVVDYGLASLDGCQKAFCLVPDSEAALQRLLEDRGFARAATYSALMKELLVHVVEPYVMPVVPA
jgi:hypothetical protein